MKFIALAAIALVAAQDEAATEEAAPMCDAETECMVTGEDGTSACTLLSDVEASAETDAPLTCDAPAMDEEMEGSSALFASVATVAVAASMMF